MSWRRMEVRRRKMSRASSWSCRFTRRTSQGSCCASMTWEGRLVNLQDQLDALDIFRRLTSIRLQDIYNLMLRNGWTLGSTYLLGMMHGVIRLYHRPVVRMLEKFWREERPDIRSEEHTSELQS